jgi:hypothetical protein
LAGLPESATLYLAYSILAGVWNESEFDLEGKRDLSELAHEFIEYGPWKRALDESEKNFLLSQVTPSEPILNA